VYRALQSGEIKPPSGGRFFDVSKQSIVFESSTATTLPLPDGPEFSVSFSFSTPYTYDPHEGNLLIGIFRSVGVDGPNPIRGFDAERSMNGLYLYNAFGNAQSLPVLVAASFSYTSVPEPCAATLLCLGALALTVRKFS
jgi:hypothetical protein